MIWLTWRQQRIGLLIFGLVFAGIAVLIIKNGLDMHSAYYQVVQGRSVAMCDLQHSPDTTCQALRANFHSNYFDPSPLFLLILLPAPAGMFLGAPLVARELEQGTYRLVWTQSVTRLRWMLVKVGAQAGAALLVFAVLTPIVLWWIGPFSGPIDGMQNFDFVGTAPLAYMVYALALAIAAGTLLRKTVPAMFVTLVDYLAVRIPIALWARPNYLPPLSVTWDPYLVAAPKMQPGSQDWTLYNAYVDRAGHYIPTAPFDTCGAGLLPGGQGQGTTVWNGLFTACAHAQGWLYTVTWQPADRFWLFQGIESAICFGLAAALLALAV